MRPHRRVRCDSNVLNGRRSRVCNDSGMHFLRGFGRTGRRNLLVVATSCCADISDFRGACCVESVLSVAVSHINRVNVSIFHCVHEGDACAMLASRGATNNSATCYNIDWQINSCLVYCPLCHSRRGESVQAHVCGASNGAGRPHLTPGVQTNVLKPRLVRPPARRDSPRRRQRARGGCPPARATSLCLRADPRQDATA